jgi:hypothetical protein
MYTEVHNEKMAWFDTEDSPNRAFAEVFVVKVVPPTYDDNDHSL